MSEPQGGVSFWRKPAVIGAAAGIGVVVVAGAVTGIAFALSDNGDQTGLGSSVVTGPGAEDTEPTPSAEPSPSGTPADEVAGSDAASLSEAISAAVAAAGGAGATQIEVQRNGWEVEVQRANGSEVEVLVGLDGSTAIREDDDGDDDDPLIDVAQLPDLVSISIEAAGGGLVEQISTDDDDYFYEVEVRLENGQDVEIKLDATLRVLEVDFD